MKKHRHKETETANMGWLNAAGLKVTQGRCVLCFRLGWAHRRPLKECSPTQAHPPFAQFANYSLFKNTSMPLGSALFLSVHFLCSFPQEMLGRTCPTPPSSLPEAHDSRLGPRPLSCHFSVQVLWFSRHCPSLCPGARAGEDRDGRS